MYISRDYYRARVGTALYRSLMAVLMVQGFQSAYAGMTLPNPSSVAFHKAFGFELIGGYPKVGYKFGRWHDVAWTYLPLQTVYATEPHDPVALPSIEPAVLQQCVGAGMRGSIDESGLRARTSPLPRQFLVQA